MTRRIIHTVPLWPDPDSGKPKMQRRMSNPEVKNPDLSAAPQ